MRGLQVGIELVERVPKPIGAQIDGFCLEAFGRRNPPPRGPIDRVFVGVVAEVEHQIQIVLQHVPVGDVVTARPVLAGDKREASLPHHLVLPRCGPEVTDTTLLVAHVELIEVVAARAQTLDLDVHRMRELRRGDSHAASDDVAHVAVGGDPPAHRHRRFAKTARIGGLGCQARPEHDAVRRRIA